MNYSAHYDALVERAKGRVLGGYIERHHVLPRCMGGTEDSGNIVSLTPEEHYVAHQLLVKIYPDVVGLVSSANLMGIRCSGNRAYGWLKRRMSAMRIGKPLSLEHKAKLSAAKKGIPLPLEHRQNIALAGIGRIVSEETRKKLSAKKIGNKFGVGRVFSEATRKKISIAKNGWVPSPETRAKISATKLMASHVS